MPVTHSEGSSNTRQSRISDSERQSTPLGKLEYSRWSGRLVSVFEALGKKMKRLFVSEFSETAALNCYNSYRLKNQNGAKGDFQRSLDDYHVACVMGFYNICHLKEEINGGELEVVVSGGSAEIKTELLSEVDKMVSGTTINLAYKFLAEGKQLLVGFLRRALVPDLIRLAMDEYGIDAETAKSSVERLIIQVGMTSNKKVSFERILEIKNKLRWLHSTSGDVAQYQAVHAAESFLPNDFRPALTPPYLAAPIPTTFQLDEDDKEYIKTVVDHGGGIKLSNTDLKNRIKRSLQRNKKTSVLNTLGIVAGVAMSGVLSGGVGAAITLVGYVGWIVAWSGGIELYRMTKAIKELKKAEASKDYNLDMSEPNALSEMDEKKFRTFLKSMRYICSHETLTRIYNTYSELEKDAQVRLDMETDEHDIDAVIRLEEASARYAYRRKNLKEALDFYSKFYQASNEDITRMEKEWRGGITDIWNTTFKGMASAEIGRVFDNAANDPRLTGSSYYIKSSKKDWLESVFPVRNEGDEPVSIEAYKRLERILEEELPDTELTEDEKKKFNAYVDKLGVAYKLTETSLRAYIKSWLKRSIKLTAQHGFKIGWHAFDDVPSLEIRLELLRHLPRPGLDGLAIFAFFFVSDLIACRINDSINQERMEHITGKKEGASYTWSMGWRERTGREEVNTLRKVAKDNLEEFEKRLLKFHDIHNEIRKDFQLHNRLGNYLSKYEIAVRILRWQQSYQLVNDMTMGVIGDFYSKAVEKTERWDKLLDGVTPPAEPL